MTRGYRLSLLIRGELLLAQRTFNSTHEPQSVAKDVRQLYNPYSWNAEVHVFQTIVCGTEVNPIYIFIYIYIYLYIYVYIYFVQYQLQF